MGSPALFVSHPPPKPAQRAFPSVGPATSAPVTLSNTANSALTHCTYCVAPTAPLVSGGEKLRTNPYCPCPNPSTFKPRLAATGGREASCTARSGVAYSCPLLAGVGGGGFCRRSGEQWGGAGDVR